MRKVNFANGEYYHIYNRGVDKRDVFCDENDYRRFLTGIREFNQIEPIGSLYELNYYRSKKVKEAKLPIGSLASKLVNIICYCLNPNHFHFILEQLNDRGIEKYMHKLGTSHTKYFNQKYCRSGSLFQGVFKAVHIDNNEYLLWLSGYINGNIEIHKISEANSYKWCSYLDYIRRNENLCNITMILDQFGSLDEYRNYVDMVIKESGKRKEMNRYFIEEM